MSSSSNDELAEINGVKPKVTLKDGEEREVKSLTSSSVYKVKRTWDHYYCTCPAWRNQGGFPVNARTCKHLKELLGEAYEIARLKLKNPEGPAPTSKSKSKAKLASKSKPASKTGKPASKGARTPTKRKRGQDDDDDEDDEDDDDDAQLAKKTRTQPARKKKSDDSRPPSSKAAPELLLANKWDIEKGPDPTGWLISEKLDGVRTFYDGKHMYSRLGNPFTPPKWFLDKLPKDVTLDGELFAGRGKFQDTISIVKTVNSPHWSGITFQVFDIPSKGDDPFEKRIKHLERLFGEKGTHASDKVEVVEHIAAKSREHVLEELKKVETLGGEGLMLRKPGSRYEGRRSATLLKVKTFYDAEAIVTGHNEGHGRNVGVCGALLCKMESGKAFKVGSGLNDKQRKDPPKVGAIITYRFQELTRDGVPRFPTFIGEAVDKDEPKDAEVPEHRKPGAKPDADDD
ncbi:DNA ligase/mRNA capping enzyme [Mucidula mucida]|nr:DNA ligase/mRNA capping enzyme [Mucidula mucida]